MIDEFLLRRAQSGDKKALEKLIQKYYDTIYAYCYHHTGDRELAEDLCQDTFVSMINHLPEYEHMQKFQNYLYVIAGNKCKDVYRKKKPLYMEEVEEERLSEQGFEDSIAQKLTVNKMLDRLDDELKEVIILRYYQDLKYQDITKILGVSQSLVKYRCKKAISQLQQYTEKEDL